MRNVAKPTGSSEQVKRISRVLRIVQLIAGQPKVWTRRRLADEFDRSERQIDKDLELIRNVLRYDLLHTRQGYHFTKAPLVKPVQLTLPEALALALAAQQAKATGAVDASAIGGALAHLEQALPAAVVPYLRRAELAPGDTFGGPAGDRASTLAMLYRALAEGRKLRITYTTASRGGAVTERTIAPYALFPHQHAWLVVAHDNRRDAIIEFNVDRIQKAWLTNEPYVVPADFDLKTYLGPAWGVLRGEAGDPEEVVLRFNSEAAAWVRDTLWHESQHMEWQDDGSLVMTFRCTVTNELVRWVLSFGARVRVDRPGSLEMEVVDEARQIVLRD